MIDTHAHLDGEEFLADLPDVIERAKAAGVEKVFLPAIDVNTCHSVLRLAEAYPCFAYPMLGLHPEEVRADYKEQLAEIKKLLEKERERRTPVIAIGEVGLDFYWSREFEEEQLAAFREQVEWSVEMRLPLMIHCRKGQNEMVKILNEYKDDLYGGVFHCFTGNEKEAEQLLQFPGFALGIGGVLTFKKSLLPETLPAVVPLERIVLETDAPYMAPVPMRGKRNESAFVAYVLARLAEAYGVSVEEAAAATTAAAMAFASRSGVFQNAL